MFYRECLLLPQIRERSLNTSRDSSVSRQSRRSISADPNVESVCTSRNTSAANTPRHSITLDDDDDDADGDAVMALDHRSLSNTSTPYPGASGRSTPCTEVSGHLLMMMMHGLL